MGLFGNAPYSLKNLVKGVLAARANGEPLQGYKYAVAFQQEDDDRYGQRSQAQANRRLANSLSEDALHDAARRAIARWNTQKGTDTQYEDGDCRIEVRSGFQYKTQQITTEIFVYDRRNSSGRHLHLVLDETENVLHERWRAK